MTAPSSAGSAFIADLLGAVDETSRAAVERVIRRHAGATVYLALQDRQEARQRRVMAARTQLAFGQGRADVVHILMDRFGVSRRQGYADVQQAQEQLHRNR